MVKHLFTIKSIFQIGIKNFNLNWHDEKNKDKYQNTDFQI